MADNPVGLLSKLLDVTIQTEKNISELNNNVKKLANNSTGPANSVGGVAGGTTGGNINGKDFETSTSGMGNLVKALAMYSLVPIKSQKKFLGFLQDYITILQESTIKKENAEGFKLVAESMQTWRKGLAALGNPLVLPFLLLGSHIFTKTVPKILKVFEDVNGAKVKEGAEGLKVIGEGMLKFSKSIAILGLTFAAIAVIGGGGGFLAAISGIVLSMAAIVGTVYLFANPKIKDGVEGFSKVGTAMKELSLGVAMLGLTFLLLGATGSLTTAGLAFVGTIVAIAGAAMLFAIPLVAKGAENISKIGKGFIYLAGAIAIVGLTFVLFSAIGLGPNPAAAAMTIIAAIAGIALVTMLFAIPLVAKGAKAINSVGIGMLFIAGSILILGLTFGLISKAFDVSPAEVGLAIATSMLGIAGAMWIAGKMSGSIIKGTIGFILIGISMILIGIGMKKMMDAINSAADTSPWEAMGQMGTALGGLALIYTAVGNPITVWMTLAGAAAMGAVGLSLIALGDGIKKFNDSGAPNFDSEGFKTLLGDLRDGFTSFVDESDGKDTNFMSKFVKGVMTSGKLAAGAIAAMNIGRALSSIGMGIAAWANLESAKEITGYDKNGNPIYGGKKYNIPKAIENIKSVLGGDGGFNILQPFIDLSNDANLEKGSGFNLMNLITGTDLSESPFARGVSIAGRIGGALSGIAAGIASFANLSAIPVITGYRKDGSPIYGGTNDLATAINNVKLVFGGDTKSPYNILDPFIAFATNPAVMATSGSFSLFKLISGEDLSDSPLERGVQIIGRIGGVLSSVAAGVGSFANLNAIYTIKGYNQKTGEPIFGDAVNLASAISNIKTVFGMTGEKSLIAAFLSLGDIDSDDFEEISESLEYIANPFLKFAEVFGKIASIKNLDVITTGFMPAISSIVNSKTMIALEDEGRFESIEDSLVYLANPMEMFAKTFKKLSEVQNLDITGKKFAIGLSWVVGATTNKKLSVENIIKFNKFAGIIKGFANIQSPFEKFVNSFDKFSDSMGKFATNFNMISPETMNTYATFTKSLNEMMQINTENLKENLNAISESVRKGPKSTVVDAADVKERKTNNTAMEEQKKDKVVSKDPMTEMLIKKLGDLQVSIDAITSTLNDGLTINGKVRTISENII
jgi:hypothetical protein